MGRIITPNREIIRPDHGLSLPPVLMSGKFKCQTHKYKSGSLKYDSGWFNNIITDAGIGYIAKCPVGGSFGQQVAMLGQCAVGTGSGTPGVSDNSLFTYLTSIYAGSSTSWQNTTGKGYTAASGPTPAYYWGQNQYVFPTGAAAGNITEIGVFPAGQAYGTGLFSHALIVDSNGNPTSITVLSDEILTVTYQVNFYIDPNDHAFSFPYNGATNNGVYRTCNMGSETTTIPDGNFQGGGGFGEQPLQFAMYSGDISALTTGQPSGSVMLSQSQGTHSFIDFVNDMANSGTWYYDWQALFPVNTGTGTIKSMSLQHTFINYQFGNLTTPITKTAGQQLSLSLRASWGRYP